VRFDPITTEIVRSAMVAITDEMKTNLMRTAYNMIIYEAESFMDDDGSSGRSAVLVETSVRSARS
jgi:N-methylhydantoinase B/oxoprolinase/acetone carboxylase alpha subunit